MTSIISRTKAKRLTLLYQGAAGLCVLGGVAVGVVGLPESASTAQIDAVSQPESAPIPGVNYESSNTQNGTHTSKTRIDPGSIAARLAMLDNAPQGAQIPDEIPAEEDPEDTTPTELGTLAKRVRYTGFIKDSDNPLAFIRIDGTQRIVAQGGIARAGSMGLDDLTIKSVKPKFILVSDGQVEERIKLAAKNGPSITMSSNPEAVVVSIPQREEDVILTPEELERLEKMPARQRALQERILRRQKMGKGVGAPMKEPIASFKAGFNKNSRNRERQPND